MKLSKAEIINKLLELPDLPVVLQQGNDEINSSFISSIEVVDAVKHYYFVGPSDEYYQIQNPLDRERCIKEGKIIEQVIWIS